MDNKIASSVFNRKIAGDWYMEGRGIKLRASEPDRQPVWLCAAEMDDLFHLDNITKIRVVLRREEFADAYEAYRWVWGYSGAYAGLQIFYEGESHRVELRDEIEHVLDFME